MLIERAAIEAMIPHSGAMCLLDAVEEWDEQHILCRTESHRRDDNPFLLEGQLDAVLLVEYGAQAAAIHASLLTEKGAEQGIREGQTAYIGAVKNLQLYEPAVAPDIKTLHIEAQCILNNANGAIYQIQCSAKKSDGEHRPIISARVVLVLPNT